MAHRPSKRNTPRGIGGWPKRSFRPKKKWRDPPKLSVRKDTPAWRRQRTGRAWSARYQWAWSNRRLRKTDALVSNRGGCAGRLLGKLLYRLQKPTRPPDIPKSYSIDVR